MKKKHCTYSTIWHFFVLLVAGLMLVGGLIYMSQMQKINYLEKEIAAQQLQVKDLEIAKYKKEIAKYKTDTTAAKTATTKK